MAAGRPSKYSDELADKMMIEIASGMSVRALCEDLDWTPDKKTFYTWMFKHPEFLHEYRQPGVPASESIQRSVAQQRSVTYRYHGHPMRPCNAPGPTVAERPQRI